MPAFTIRPAALADCRGLAQVQVDSYQAAYAGLFPPVYLARFTYEEQEQDWRDFLAAGTGDILLVATAGEQIAGYVLARADPDSCPGFDAEIVAVHVRHSLQRQGIGRKLLRRASTTLAARGCRSVMLWTLTGNPTRTWYERLQARLVGDRSFQVDGWDIVEVAYGWENIAALL